jgi:hypothetical protein
MRFIGGAAKGVGAIAFAVTPWSCGSAQPTHDATLGTRHDRAATIECLSQTDFSNQLARGADAIIISFSSADGVSALEHVVAGFGEPALDVIVRGRVASALGLGGEPTWIERQGDVEVRGFGPYEPRAASEQGVPPEVARAQADALGKQVRSAVDGCLRENAR